MKAKDFRRKGFPTKFVLSTTIICQLWQNQRKSHTLDTSAGGYGSGCRLAGTKTEPLQVKVRDNGNFFGILYRLDN